MNPEPVTNSFAERPSDSRNRQERIAHLEDRITELAAHIHAATFRWLKLIREFDECQGWEGPGMNSCAHWLNWKCGINLGAAREKVRVAHALKTLPKISEAFRGGSISYSKVRAMTRVATSENEDYLLMIATHGTAAHVERLVRQYRKVKRIEALERDNRRHAMRELNWHFDDDGSLVIKGRFSPEQGVLIKKALEFIMDEDAAEQDDVSAETPENSLEPASDPVANRRADAMVRMAEGYLSAADATASSGDRYLVHIHAGVETLKHDGDAAEAEIEQNSTISAEASRRICCDAGIVHWLQNTQGEPLNVGRKTRTIPPAIRRALRRRDGGCRFPGCTCTLYVDAHHIKHWADGGETSMDNLVLLCRRHHRLVHEGGFGVHVAQNKDIFFTDRSGQDVFEAAETRFSGNVVQLYDEHQGANIRITPGTGIPAWHGESMDDDLAIHGLLQLDSAENDD